jgi:hypothetical protein
MAKFELIPENNNILPDQVFELLDSSHEETRQWAARNAHIITELDQETAEKVDSCASLADWLALTGKETLGDLTGTDRIISEFLNKRDNKYKTAAIKRKRAERIRDSVLRLVTG